MAALDVRGRGEEDPAPLTGRRAVTSGRRPVSLFVEARLSCGADGTWRAMDPATGAAAWGRYARAGVDLRMVARAQRGELPGAPALDGSPDVGPLPYYLGLRGLARTLPRLVLAVGREVVRADVVLLRLPGVIGLLAGLVCRVLGRRYCVELVGDPVDVLASGSLGRRARALAPVAGLLLRSVVRRSAGALYVTEATLQRRYPPPPGAPTVNVSGVRLADSALVERSLRWRPGPARIITVGSQELPYKGHDVLLRAVHRLLSDGVDVQAVIVGDGRLHRELVELSARLGLADRVTFTGAVSDRQRLLGLLDEASVFVLPSLTEGLPRALLEAMARALPAVGTAVGGTPELLDERFLVPAGDADALAGAVAALTADPPGWEAQSERNLAVARAFRADILDARFSQWLCGAPDARRGPRG